MNRAVSFRHLLALILLLGMVISTMSLYAVVRVLSLTVAQRVERARESVLEISAGLAKRPTDTSLTSTFVGLRAGRASAPRDLEDVPSTWRPIVADAVRETSRSGLEQSRTYDVGASVLVLDARPSMDGSDVVWAAYLVTTPTYLGTWRWVVEALAVTMALLVAVALYSVVTLQRGVASLHAGLGALSDDLSAPVPRPGLRELDEVAGGIAALATRLAQSREHQEQLGRELMKQQRLAALGRVVAGVAHEVRNPLASIKLRLDLAAASAELPAAIEADLSKASAEIARLDTLVADLLATSGRTSGAKTSTDLGELARARVELLAPWTATHRVDVCVDGHAEAEIDASAVSRALDNLIRNAVEASPSGGVVRVRVAGASERAWVEVEDRGDGVDPASVAQLFEPFFTTKPAGTGLGLAISLAVARAHGGDVQYVRRDATTFVFSLGGPVATSG